MGILNVTPDSFSDGGRFDDPGRAVAQGLRMVRDGADLIDVGGESTRPGARAVSAAEELRRILPVIDVVELHGRGAYRNFATERAVDARMSTANVAVTFANA